MTIREWTEHGQRFRLEGSVIRTLATGKMRLSYGDERLDEIRSIRTTEAPPIQGRLRRLLSRFALRERASAH